MFELVTSNSKTSVSCAHCGDECPTEHPLYDDKDFCCNGCQVIYTVLNDNGLGDYYTFQDTPGVSQKWARKNNYAFLDDEDVVSSLLEFNEKQLAKISFSLPQIHCASCLWLLENLGKLVPGVIHSRVNFLAKTATISYNPEIVSLRRVVEQLAAIGYPPELNMQKLVDKPKTGQDRSLFYKLGLAGFAFGNIMMLSFPEYLGFEKASVKFYLGYLNILLAIPVLLYSGFSYLRSAWWTVRMRQINIDIPIAVGMLTLFFRSIYEIVTATGEGYLDSLAGFVFFLLVGKWFQNYTFYSITFDRNYKSYFPISAVVRQGDEWITKTLDKIEAGDLLMIKNEEIIPADAVMMSQEASIDYSFVTGESDLIRKKKGDKLFAGGKNIGANIQVQALKKIDQSYLTKLWDDDAFKIDKEEQTQTLIDKIGRYFTLTIMSIAVLTLIYWLMYDKSLAFNAFTAVLIVACPCALALAIPFSYGNIMRILGRNHFYLKNVQVIDRIQGIDEIIFDKTGTITDHKNITATNSGKALDTQEQYLIKSATFQSNHPLSKAIFNQLDGGYASTVQHFEEITGKGTITQIDGHTIKIGSSAFLDLAFEQERRSVLIEIDGKLVTWYHIEHHLRTGVETLVATLGKRYAITILSGDNNSEEARLKGFFPVNSRMEFNQSPLDKLHYIKSRQEEGHHVMMIGDGLNDAGALKQSDVGIVISEESNNFTPACDAILSATVFDRLLIYLTKLHQARSLIKGAFILAFLYNVVGLFFAVRGELSPIVAAILMPLSSITVMVYGLLSSNWLFRDVDR